MSGCRREEVMSDRVLKARRVFQNGFAATQGQHNPSSAIICVCKDGLRAGIPILMPACIVCCPCIDVESWKLFSRYRNTLNQCHPFPIPLLCSPRSLNSYPGYHKFIFLSPASHHKALLIEVPHIVRKKLVPSYAILKVVEVSPVPDLDPQTVQQ